MSRAAAIFAVRSVVGRLAQPAAQFLNAVAAVSSCGLLTQELPLADVSPFGGLAGVAGRPKEDSHAADPAARMDLPRPIVTASRRPDPAAESRRSRGEQAPPVFSFRRSGVPGAGPPSGIAPPAIEWQEGPAAAVPPGGQHSGLASGDRHPGQTSGALALLDAFATELLAAPAVEGLSADRARSGGMPANEARKPRPPSETGPPEIGRREAVSTTAVPPGGKQSGLASGVRHPGNASGALALLDAFATELLAAPAVQRPTSRLEAAPGLSAAARPSAPALDLNRREISAVTINPVLAGAPSEPSLADLATRSSSQNVLPGLDAGGAAQNLAAAARAAPSPAESLAMVSAPGNPDADTLASMVNEVLAEQARRHGVDLS